MILSLGHVLHVLILFTVLSSYHVQFMKILQVCQVEIAEKPPLSAQFQTSFFGWFLDESQTTCTHKAQSVFTSYDQTPPDYI